MKYVCLCLQQVKQQVDLGELRPEREKWYTSAKRDHERNARMKKTNISTKRNTLKNPKRREADQLAIYKHDRGVELGSTEKQPN